MSVAPERRKGGSTRSLPEVVVDRDDAVAVLFHRHSADLVGLAFCLGDRDAAEEVVQDAFVALHRHWRDLPERAAALAYLRAAVVNGCRSRQRRLVRARTVLPALRPVRTSVPFMARDGAKRG